MSNLNLKAVLELVDKASKPLQQINQQADGSSTAILQLSTNINRLNKTLSGNQLNQYDKSIKHTEQNTRLLKKTTQLLGTEYTHVDHILDSLTGKLKAWDKKVKDSRTKLRQEFKDIALGGTAVGFGMYKFLEPAIDFEKQVSSVQAVLDLEKTSTAMKMLEADARKWGAASSFSPSEAAKAQFALGSGGFDANKIHDALGGTLQLAEAGKVELEQAAQIAVGTLNGFGLAAKDIGRVNDVFLQATNATATSVDGLGETMKYVAPIAKAYGSSLEETTAITGLLGNNNILDTQAGTSLRSIMTRFAAPPSEAKKTLKALNVKTSDSKGNLRELGDVLEEIQRKTAKMGEAKRLDIFKNLAGQEAISAFAVLIDQSHQIDETTGKPVNNIKKLTKELQNSQGAAARAAAILKDNLAGDIENMTGAWQDFSISIEKVLGKDLRHFVQQISGIIDRIKAWVDANPELVRTLAKVAMQLLLFKVAMLSVKYTGSLLFGSIIHILAGITKLTLAIWIIKKLAKGLGLGLPSRLFVIGKAIRYLAQGFMLLARNAIPLVIRGIVMMTTALLTNPIVLIIALIAVLALAIYKYWEPIKAFFKGFWDGLKQGLAPLGDSLSSVFSNLKTTLAPLKPLWDGLVSVFETVIGVVGEMFEPFQATNDQLKSAHSNGEALGIIFGAIVGVIGEAFISIGTAIGEFIGWLVMLPERIGTAFGELKNQAYDLGISFLNFLLSPIQAVISEVNNLIQQLNRIPGIKIPEIPQIQNFGNQTTKVNATTPVKPLMMKQAGNQTNYFAPAQIHITGVTDPKAAGTAVGKEMNLWQQQTASKQNRNYADHE